MDLTFLAGAFSPLVNSQHEASIASCKHIILEQAMAVAQGKVERPDPLAHHLNTWLDTAEVTDSPSLSLLAHRINTMAKPWRLCSSRWQEGLAVSWGPVVRWAAHRLSLSAASYAL